MEVTRERAWDTLTKYTQSEALRRHAPRGRGQSGGTRATTVRTRSSGAPPPSPRLRLRDTLRRSTSTHRTAHPSCARRATPRSLVESVLSHAEHLSMPRDTQLKKTLCLRRVRRVRPRLWTRPARWHRDARAEVRAQEAQAAVLRAGVHRAEVYEGAEQLGIDLDEQYPQRRRGDAPDRRSGSG